VNTAVIHCHLIIICISFVILQLLDLRFVNILLYVFRISFSFSIWCILRVCIAFVLLFCCFSFCALPFLFLYMSTEHCHRVEAQFQSINITTNVNINVLSFSVMFC